MKALAHEELPRTLTSTLVLEAYSTIKDKVTKTPILTNEVISSIASRPSLSQHNGYQICPDIRLYLKCENFQRTGSFKYRGAAHSIEKLTDNDLRRGLLTTSSGNHAKALATAARDVAQTKQFEIPVFVVMPKNASDLKVKAAEEAGAVVVRSGNSWAEREAKLEELRRRDNLTVISSSDNLNVILGQGTLAVEVVSQMQTAFGVDLDCIVVPCGGGGMLSGVAIALKDTPVKVFGAEPADDADDALRSLKIGHRIDKVTSVSVADGLRCPLGKLPWEVIKQSDLVNGIYSASEEQIHTTIALVRHLMGIVIEPSAAVPLAVVLFNEDFREYITLQKQQWRVGVVFSGGNCKYI